MKFESGIEKILFEAITCPRDKISATVHDTRLRLREEITKMIIGEGVVEPDGERDEGFNEAIGVMKMTINSFDMI